MKLGALLLALAAIAVLVVVVRGSRQLKRRNTPQLRRRVESLFERVEKPRPLEGDHYYRRYWS